MDKLGRTETSMNDMPLLLLALLLGLSGCSGTIYTYDNPVDACVETEHGCKYAGVLYRPLIPNERRFMHDRILDNAGKVTHHIFDSAGKKCRPVVVTVVELIPDPNNQHLITYDAEFFETAKFGVELNDNGTLSKVNSESTPGGKSLVDSLVSLVVTREAVLAGAGTPAMQGLIGDDDAASFPFCSHGEISVPDL